MSIDQWSTTAANNATGVTGITWAEGQAPSTVNDSARELMAQVAAWLANPTLVASIGAFTTGDVKLTLKTVADTGWVLMNDGSIGSAASAATTRANADTSSLYTLLWNNTANAECPVSTGRGANAAADFAANKTLTLPLALGRALACYGAGSGLTARVLGKTTGTETVTLATADLPAHAHSGVGQLKSSDGSGVGVSIASSAASSTTSGGDVAFAEYISTANAGGGGSHANMQPTAFLNCMIKL